jgi:hypothetical protein
VIEVGEDLQFIRLAMSPTDALRVLDALESGASASVATFAGAS